MRAFLRFNASDTCGDLSLDQFDNDMPGEAWRHLTIGLYGWVRTHGNTGANLFTDRRVSTHFAAVPAENRKVWLLWIFKPIKDNRGAPIYCLCEGSTDNLVLTVDSANSVKDAIQQSSSTGEELRLAERDFSNESEQIKDVLSELREQVLKGKGVAFGIPSECLDPEVFKYSAQYVLDRWEVQPITESAGLRSLNVGRGTSAHSSKQNEPGSGSSMASHLQPASTPKIDNALISPNSSVPADRPLTSKHVLLAFCGIVAFQLLLFFVTYNAIPSSLEVPPQDLSVPKEWKDLAEALRFANDVPRLTGNVKLLLERLQQPIDNDSRSLADLVAELQEAVGKSPQSGLQQVLTDLRLEVDRVGKPAELSAENAISSAGKLKKACEDLDLQLVRVSTLLGQPPNEPKSQQTRSAASLMDRLNQLNVMLGDAGAAESKQEHSISESVLNLAKLTRELSIQLSGSDGAAGELARAPDGSLRGSIDGLRSQIELLSNEIKTHDIPDGTETNFANRLNELIESRVLIKNWLNASETITISELKEIEQEIQNRLKRGTDR